MLRAVVATLLLVAVTLANAAPPPVTVPALDFRERTLANGLRVVTLEDHSSPTVSVQVWYEVGGKDDPPGRSGFAHLFEHLMFKSTRNLPAESFDRMTEDVGGFNNATTREDVTSFFEVVPSNHLERLLWAEAERMRNLDVSEANFKSERAVVEEEYRERVLADPYGRFYESFAPNSYAVLPYKRGVIGNIGDLEAASLDDVRKFHDTYYRPDNAILIVAGDFDRGQVDAWIDKYFGAIPRPAAPLPRVDAVEPPRTKDRRVRVTGPNVPLPAVAITWLAPPARSADAPALKVAAAILGSGDSSRINQALVYRAQIAQTASFSAEFRVDTGLLIAYAIAARGAPLDKLEGALRTQVDALAQKPVSQAELDKVKIQIVTGALDNRQTPFGKATAIGDALVYHGDAHYADKALSDLLAVTAVDVQRVVRKYLVDARSVTIDYVQAGKP